MNTEQTSTASTGEAFRNLLALLFRKRGSARAMTRNVKLVSEMDVKILALTGEK